MINWLRKFWARLGWLATAQWMVDRDQVRRMQRLIDEAQKMPCRGVNVNICVAEGCYNEACLKSGSHADD